MSNFYKLTKNPQTGEIQEAFWLDDYFGPRRYAVRFEDGLIVDPEKVKLETFDSLPVDNTSPKDYKRMLKEATDLMNSFQKQINVFINKWELKE